jgi:hypothetical protein
MLDRAVYRYAQARESGNTVLLVESAELVLGRTTCRVANLTVVASDNKDPSRYRMFGTAFGLYELSAASGLWDSQAAPSHIEHSGLPYRVAQTARPSEVARP